MSNVFSPKSYDFNGRWTKETQFAKPSTLCLLTIPKSSSDTYSKPLLVSNKIEILRRLTCRVPSGCTSIKHTYLLLWDEREWDFNIFLTCIMLGWYSTVILRFASLISNCITLYNSKTTGFVNGTYIRVVCTYRRLIASVIKLLRRMCRLKGQEVRGPWVKQYNTKVNNFCSLPNTGCLQKNGAVSKINKKFISHLTRAKRTPSAAAAVQVSHALPAVRFSCLMRGRGASFQDGPAVPH